MSITPSDLITGDAYAAYQRPHLTRLIAHRRNRTVALGPAMCAQFEDETTVRHQIQEVLRVEGTSDADRVKHEIEMYARLVPDAAHWTATLLIELPDARQQQRELPALNQAAHHLYVEIQGMPRIVARANEDLPDGHRTRPSAVHFLRFPPPLVFRATVLAGRVDLGCDHSSYPCRTDRAGRAEAARTRLDAGR